MRHMKDLNPKVNNECSKNILPNEIGQGDVADGFQ